MSFTIETNPLGQLVLKRSGQEDAVDVRMRRVFPWTNPRMVSIRSADGKELLLIEDLTSLEESLRRHVEAILADSQVIPRILSVENLEMRFGHQEWKVQTDRGPVEFRVQEREDVRFLQDGRFSVKDADGMLYELPRPEELDEPSRRALERLL